MTKLGYGIIAAAGLAATAALTAQEALFNRPAEVTAIMAGGRMYPGTYKASQMARVCGETDPAQFVTGERTFLIEFPLDDDPEITDLRFDSKELVRGATTTTKFYVSVTVKAKNGGRPPAYFVDTARPTPGDSGRASLKVAGGTVELTVTAADSLGQTLNLTVVCRPRRP